MEEEQDPSPEYIKGFNQMYKLKKEMPEVAQQILATKAEDDRFKGMKAGSKQYEIEKLTEQMLASKLKGNDKER